MRSPGHNVNGTAIDFVPPPAYFPRRGRPALWGHRRHDYTPTSLVELGRMLRERFGLALTEGPTQHYGRGIDLIPPPAALRDRAPIGTIELKHCQVHGQVETDEEWCPRTDHGGQCWRPLSPAEPYVPLLAYDALRARLEDRRAA